MIRILMTVLFILLLIAIVGWEVKVNGPTYKVGANPRNGVAGPGFKRQLAYHGELAAHWDYDLGTWVFARNNQTVKLKVR